MKSKTSNKIYNGYIIILSIIVLLPFLAPILMHLGLDFVAKYIYFLYSFSCHQFDHRSIHIFDYQMAWCARDTAIWLGIWCIAILTKIFNLHPMKFLWVLPFAVFITLDGGIQTIYTILDVKSFGVNDGMPIYISNNFMRFMSGAIFGIGLSLWISTNVWAESQDSKEKKQLISFKKLSSILIPTFVIFYIILVQIWQITSPNHKPANMLDSVVRTPYEDFFVRRRHGICPTGGEYESNYKNPVENLTAIDCFF